MLINNWFDLVLDTVFIVFLGVGMCLIYSVFLLVSVYKASKAMNFEWGGIFDKKAGL